MRFLVPVTAALLLAACASTPKPIAPPVRPVVETPHIRSDVIGLTANELAARFGQPQLQVREGAGTKLQFGATGCVLDAYLYPPPSGSGVARVTHVDTRGHDGRSVAQPACITALDVRRP